MRFRTAVVLFALGAGALAATAAAATDGLRAGDPEAVAHRCGRGYVHGVIDGKHRCLKAGQPCSRRFDRQYHRYGFHCHGARLTPRSPAPSPPPAPEAGKVVAKIPLGAPGRAVAAGDDGIWVVLEDQRVVRVDPAANVIAATLSTPRGEWPPVAEVGFGALWLSVPNPNSLLRVDPQANGVVATIPVGHSPEGLAFGFGSVWVANHRSDAGDPRVGPTAAQGTFSISRVDPSTNRETARIAVEVREHSDPWMRFCCGPQGITVAAGAVWTADAYLRAVIKVDPDANRAVAKIPITQGNSCGGMAGDDAAVWLASGCGSSTVVRIDPRTNAVVATIDVISTAGDVALGGGSLWASTSRELVRIDPAMNQVRGRTILPSVIEGIAYGAGAIWITAGNDLLRIEPVPTSAAR